MTQFEYRVITHPDATLVLNTVLNNEGQQGWDLVALIDRPAVFYMVLKRPVALPVPAPIPVVKPPAKATKPAAKGAR